MRKLIFTLIIMAGALRADGEKAGEFDYYVLALSWTPRGARWRVMRADQSNAMRPKTSAGRCMACGRSFTKAGPAIATRLNANPAAR